MVPLKYNVRSLRARKIGSLMTVFGVAMVVWASVFAFGLSAGLDHTLEVAVHPLDLIVLRKGSTSESVSAISDKLARDVVALPGIATNRDGQPLAAYELVAFGYLARRGATTEVNVTVRGVEPISKELREGMQLVAGRDFRPGVREAIASRAMAQRFQGLGLNEQFPIEGEMYTVVGIFEAGGGAVESEVWTDHRVLAPDVDRVGALSCLQLRAASKSDQEKLIKRMATDEQIDLEAKTEDAYFAQQKEESALIKVIGSFIAIFLTIGAMFAVANTMFGAVASRAREIGTLRALGFGRLSVVAAFVLESVVLCGVGAVLGCLAAKAIEFAMGGLQTGTMNNTTFTEVVFAFDFGPAVLLQGALLAVIMGLVGGLLPALRAVRMKVVDALREV